MGVVYKGEHIRLKRLTAIKTLSPELSNNPGFVARFHREAKMASNLNHLNAVTIYDFGEAEDGLLYLAMELLDGRSLDEILKEEKVLSLPRVVNITCQAAAALDAAHQSGLIHRDVKPHNVMISSREDESDWVKVVDFGTGKYTQDNPLCQALTQKGYIIGTPEYMSPEQVGNEDLDLRSDIYSLAVVAYEMLTGRLPFTGATRQACMILRLLQDPPPFRQVNPPLELPPGVEQVIMKALSRNPDDRYSSAGEFASELEAATRPVSTHQSRPVQSGAGVLTLDYSSDATTIRGLIERTSSLDTTGPQEVEPFKSDRSRSSPRKVVSFRVDLCLASIALMAAIVYYCAASMEYLPLPIPVTELSPPPIPIVTVEIDDKVTGTQPVIPIKGTITRSETSDTGPGPEPPLVVGPAGVQPAPAGMPEVAILPDPPQAVPKPPEGPSPEEHMTRGLELYGKGSYEEAITEFLAVERIQPSNQDVQYLLGSAYHKLGKLIDARAHYRRCTYGPYAIVARRHVKNISKKLDK
jgi:serine/threonine protein kinase